jgi:hypothetical protein
MVFSDSTHMSDSDSSTLDLFDRGPLRRQKIFTPSASARSLHSRRDDSKKGSEGTESSSSSSMVGRRNRRAEFRVEEGALDPIL